MTGIEVKGKGLYGDICREAFFCSFWMTCHPLAEADILFPCGLRFI